MTKVQMSTDDLTVLLDSAKQYGSAMLIFGDGEPGGERVCLVAVEEPKANGKPARPRAPRTPRTKAAGAAVDPAAEPATESA